MAASTGPVIATGAIALFNTVVLKPGPPEHIPEIMLATAIVGGGLALFERVNEQLAVGIAWIALVTVMVTRLDPNTPSPIENFAKWYNTK